jgi:hypothetical protein
MAKATKGAGRKSRYGHYANTNMRDQNKRRRNQSVITRLQKKCRYWTKQLKMKTISLEEWTSRTGRLLNEIERVNKYT